MAAYYELGVSDVLRNFVEGVALFSWLLLAVSICLPPWSTCENRSFCEHTPPANTSKGFVLIAPRPFTDTTRTDHAKRANCATCSRDSRSGSMGHKRRGVKKHPSMLSICLIIDASCAASRIDVHVHAS